MASFSRRSSLNDRCQRVLRELLVIGSLQLGRFGQHLERHQGQRIDIAPAEHDADVKWVVAEAGIVEHWRGTVLAKQIDGGTNVGAGNALAVGPDRVA